ncbi:protein transporter Sec31 [Streptomyces sp. NBC_00669]|uniref:protein transporter Sec31 n=1 Tax=Streptomyces sp. NBC_00669 TaxID=2976011 RepID=UPI002E358A1A|nr:protein transporter Sec31 [Streptomyces sp. NBC_00669]
MTGFPDTPAPQPQIPGVRYRTEQRERRVPITVGGETRMVPETYTVTVPVPPRDWDRAVLRGVTAAACVGTGLSVAWTTTGIGALLAATVPAPVAYGVASIFDTTWLACLGLEWLERHDPERATAARVGGWIALTIAVTAVVVHGYVTGAIWAGGVGAAVSVLAKGLWVIVLRYYAVPLGPRIGGWVIERRREVAAERVLAAELRRADGQEAYAAAVYGPSAAQARAAVFTAKAELPDPAERPRPAPANPSAPAPAEASVPDPADPEPPDAAAAAQVHSLDTDQPSIASTIRDCRSRGITDLADIVDRCRDVHGDRPTLAATVARTLRREERRTAS